MKNELKGEPIFDDALISIGRHVLVYALAVFLPAGISILSIAIFTRLFEPSAYGEYSLVITTVGILTTLLAQWIQQSTLRYRSAFMKQQQVWQFNNNWAALLLILTVAFPLIAMLLFPVLRDTLGSYHRFYWVAVALVISSLWYENIGTLLQADLRSIQYAWFRIGNAVLRLVLALGWLYLIARDVIGIMWSILLAQFIFVILMMYSFKQDLSKVQSASSIYFSFKAFCEFVNRFTAFGLPMIGWMLGTKLLNISDRYLLQFFKGSAEVGIYSPIYDLVSYNLGLLSTPLLMVAHPLLMKVANAEIADHSRLQEMVTTFSRYFLLITFFMLVFIAVFAQELASVFLGPAYQEGAVIIPILLIGFLAWNFSMYGHKGLEVQERTRTMLSYVLTCVVANIILNLYFIPHYGYIGAALTTSISFFLYPVLIYFGTRSGIAWKIPWSSMGRIGLASFCTAGGLIVIKCFLLLLPTLVLLLIAASIGIFIYVAMIYILREIKPDEVRIVWQIIRRLRLFTRRG